MITFLQHLAPVQFVALALWYFLIECFVYAISFGNQRLAWWASLIIATMWPVILPWLGVVALIRWALRGRD